MAMRKRKKSPSPTLPQEIYAVILAKLPSKSILKFRCVSKLWCSLIDEPSFIATHLKNRTSTQDESRLLLWKLRGSKQFCTIHRSDTFRSMSTLEIDYDKYTYYTPVGYINGVLCLKKYETKIGVIRIFLWNPSIRKALEVPRPQVAITSKGRFGGLNMVCAFGFDPVRNDYKIVASVHLQGGGKHSKFDEIYTLSTNSWKSISEPKGPCFWMIDHQKAYLNGVVYWMGINPRGKFPHLVSFDVGKDVFEHIDVPDFDPINDDFEKFPIVLDKSIALMEIFSDFSNIWVRRESSWTKRHVIHLQLLYECLYLKNDGNLLYGKKGEGVHSYNLENEQDKVLVKKYRVRQVPEIFAGAYVESLVLSKGYDDRNVFTFPAQEMSMDG